MKKHIIIAMIIALHSQNACAMKLKKDRLPRCTTKPLNEKGLALGAHLARIVGQTRHKDKKGFGSYGPRVMRAALLAERKIKEKSLYLEQQVLRTSK